MKKILAATALAFFLPAAASADVTKEDILKLSNAGISQDVIVNFIRANAPVRNLTADEIVALKEAGVGERVLAALTARPAKPEPKPAPAVASPRSTVVTEWRTPVNYYYYSVPRYTYWPTYSYSYGYSNCSPYTYGSTYYRPYRYSYNSGYGYSHHYRLSGRWCR